MIDVNTYIALDVDERVVHWARHLHTMFLTTPLVFMGHDERWIEPNWYNAITEVSKGVFTTEEALELIKGAVLIQPHVAPAIRDEAIPALFSLIYALTDVVMDRQEYM